MDVVMKAKLPNSTLKQSAYSKNCIPFKTCKNMSFKLNLNDMLAEISYSNKVEILQRP